jgi:hypothetical protein
MAISHNFELADSVQESAAVFSFGGLQREDLSILRQITKSQTGQSPHDGQSAIIHEAEKLADSPPTLQLDKILIDREREFAQRNRVEKTINKYFSELDRTPWYYLEDYVTKSDIETYLSSAKATKLTPEEKTDMRITVQRFDDISSIGVSGARIPYIQPQDLVNFSQGKKRFYDPESGWTVYDDKTIPGNALPDSLWQSYGRRK